MSESFSAMRSHYFLKVCSCVCEQSDFGEDTHEFRLSELWKLLSVCCASVDTTLPYEETTKRVAGWRLLRSPSI